MALHQISLSSSPSMMLRSSSPTISLNPDYLRCTTVIGGGDRDRLMAVKNSSSSRRRSLCTQVRSSLDATAGPVVGQVTAVCQETFWPLVKAAGDKVVVLDMYTQWCGPCKVMAPKYEKLSQELLDVVFMKLDCNQENKALAKELGIRAVPTFKILKDGKVVKEVTGAKYDELVASIKIVQST